jgi:hypothetical protein
MYAVRNVGREFWLLATRDPGWMSLSAVLLAVPGAGALAVRRPLLLLRVAGTLLVTFGVLGRGFLPDELVGARYFLFTIPVFLIVSGQGFELLLTPVSRRYRAVVAAVGIVVLGVWSGLAARPAYAIRYAFQDEYTFARQALAELPDGCAVYEVPIRSAALPRDVDCCLDLSRSPLVLDFPRLRFRKLPDDFSPIFDDSPCVAYYESIACAITNDGSDSSEPVLVESAANYFGAFCSRVRTVGRLVSVAEISTSPRATVNFFHEKRPRAALYRWTP